ncbi:N-acyl homoserine lactonase family protein [Xanthobacter autotrophicus]|uniref:N-acyl homoserine lactonase family protein n=1 Tax=Xanthobacter autotrophicus TaxID=280 RepID=UPI0024A74E27|nr:N-acyl homoserine lactonase family protein [Xanthobacter autotrophicus]MDI4655134.1 N-acyl homoserine lactonase family protein [Xanthobacter autotrophicus]
MSAVEIPSAPRKPGEGVRLFAFTVGYVHLPLSYFLKGEQGEVKAPVTAFLIDHPKGLVLFDTGLGQRFVRPRGSPADSFIDIEQGDTMLERVRALGVDPADVRWIISSHFHADHCGGNGQFPNATIIIGKAEHDFARDNADGQLYCREEFDTGQPLLKVHGEHDVFGDGTVVVFATAGHTPGHQSARVRTDGGDIVLTADCCTMQRSLEEFRLPEHCHDADQALASLKLLAGLRQKGARVFPSHDPDFWETVAKNVPVR